MVGKVYLVGAGPGDPRLITVKGLNCIEQGDVIVYDRLANPSLLKKMKRGAEKIYVGKRTDRHTLKQEEINQLLVDLALSGKNVVRLKGGDPTIFGRVGEEAEMLRKHGITYEIVPGITAAISVPAYAGIPVTHRELASSLSIITGHESPDKLDESIDWEKVTKATGTLVFMMGVANIGHISKQLILHGRPSDTPVALIRWGTRAEQDTLIGNLGNIEQKVKEANFKPPAVTVVGDVVNQRDKLKWAENMPLFGTRVLVTRTRTQASDLVRKIEDLGGESYEFPVIDIEMPDKEKLEATNSALERLSEYDWVFFTSVNGVEYFFSHLERLGKDIRSLYKARIAAVGPATKEALRKHGIVSEELPGRFQAEGLIEAFGDLMKAGQKVLLPRGDLARSWLPEILIEKGLSVTEAIMYETVPTHDEDDELLRLLHKGGIHAVTFTSSSTVTNFLAALTQMGVENPVQALNGVKIACIGPVTANTAEKVGLEVDILAEEATIDSLVAGLCAWKLQNN
ncbi:uroporphyrinogen III methyltransferase/synthase [Fontibacillus solani]|uniref:Uroporphyrinogen-III C-methyltransferase n=1 Tax=Fontibacillus solani TaxID=1572857 RepID=A0A7W3SXH6_9BACL|nr:uroporphyrinogen-III C-methyltransferase [Fontibacillus solani]MBA9088066.1 uroporphyrinogen III methyltransferase/synthase [Fontibacillus solani]